MASTSLLFCSAHSWRARDFPPPPNPTPPLPASRFPILDSRFPIPSQVGSRPIFQENPRNDTDLFLVSWSLFAVCSNHLCFSWYILKSTPFLSVDRFPFRVDFKIVGIILPSPRGEQRAGERSSASSNSSCPAYRTKVTRIMIACVQTSPSIYRLVYWIVFTEVLMTGICQTIKVYRSAMPDRKKRVRGHLQDRRKNDYHRTMRHILHIVFQLIMTCECRCK